MKHRISRALLVSILYWMPLWLGCSGSPAPQPADATRVENAGLGIAIAALPEPFELRENEGIVLELAAPGSDGDGDLWFEVDPEEIGGINLVAAAEGSKAWFEGQPEGRYFGNLELVTPLGTAYTARGSYAIADLTVEELRVFALHPAANRLLRLTYRYPPGQGRERMQHVAELLGELEALDAESQDASSSSPES